jgi:hypothetical protein
VASVEAWSSGAPWTLYPAPRRLPSDQSPSIVQPKRLSFRLERGSSTASPTDCHFDRSGTVSPSRAVEKPASRLHRLTPHRPRERPAPRAPPWYTSPQ